ncbi:hypothetical protein ACLOJK_024536 [Asimina triloba]
MAAVLESLAVPRASGVRTPLLSRPAAASVGRRKASRFTAEFSGLRIQTRGPQLTLATERRGRRMPRRGIVCEAQETAVDGEGPDLAEMPPHRRMLSTVSEYLLVELYSVPGTVKLDIAIRSHSSLPVLVEFWAPWCGPCRMIHPVIDELSRDYAGKLKCFKVNTDECPSIATQYGIRSIPTVIVFKNGIILRYQRSIPGVENVVSCPSEELRLNTQNPVWYLTGPNSVVTLEMRSSVQGGHARQPMRWASRDVS